MVDFLDNRQAVTWKSPTGKVFELKTLESGYSRKHIGDVKENPKTTYSSSRSSSSGKKGSHSSSNVSTSGGVKRVQDSNDTFSDLGIGGKDVSLDCLFVGNDHDQRAREFEDALCEIGKSKLRLAYGDEFTVNVLNFSVKNNLVENINLTTVSVNFHQTSSTSYPESSKSSTKRVQNAVSETNKISAENFEAAVNNVAADQVRASKFMQSYNNMMSKVSNCLSAANNITVGSIMSDILGQNIMSNSMTMTSQLQIALSQAVGLSSRVKRLGSGFALPSSLVSIKSSLLSLLGGLKTSGTKYPLTSEQIDSLIINNTTAQAVITSLAQSSISSEYVTRQEAISAANELLAAADDWNEYFEQEYQKISDLKDAFDRDTKIDEVISAAISAITEMSYNLKIEKTLILTEDESTVNLAYKHYRQDFEIDPGGAVEYLISSNDWSGDQFYLIPKGTEVKLYV